jgi:hypothetical protein
VAILISASEVAQGLLAGKFPSREGRLVQLAVDLICEQIQADPLQPETFETTGLGEAPKGVDLSKLLSALSALLSRRHFKLCAKLASIGLTKFPQNALLHRRKIQALIDVGELELAKLALDAAATLVPISKADRDELIGLRGRYFKQRAIASWQSHGTLDANDLEASLLAYGEVFKANVDTAIRSSYWHGINVVAILALSEENGAQVDLSCPPLNDLLEAIDAKDLTKLASKILAARREDFLKVGSKYWSCATASEACLALKDDAQAELWLWRALDDPAIDEFSLGSTLRQYREIWHIKPNTQNGRLITMLEQALVRLGSFQFSADLAVAVAADESGAMRSHFEKVFGREKFLGYDRLRTIFQACAAVARIETFSEERTLVGVGTGFLVAGRQLSPNLPDEFLLVTNAHVLSETVKDAVAPANARVRFEVDARADSAYLPLEVDQIIWSSPPGEPGSLGDPLSLDVTIARLKFTQTPTSALKISFNRPKAVTKLGADVNTYAAPRAYVLGHPEGDGLQISLHDSELIDADDTGTLVHYRTPTLGGNSGSPVLDDAGCVFALHHAGTPEMPRLHGVGTYPANEGICLLAIQAALATFKP